MGSSDKIWLMCCVCGWLSGKQHQTSRSKWLPCGSPQSSCGQEQ